MAREYNAFENNDLSIRNYYKELHLSKKLSRKELQDELDYMRKKTNNVDDLMLIDLAEEYIVKNKERYDKYLERHSKAKKKKIFKVVRNVILTGTIAAVGIASLNAYINNKNEENIKSNVCIEYEVQEGDTRNELEDVYGLKDISFEYEEISGYQRQQASGGDTSRFLAAGDVIIARTTKENADRLVKEKGATIITIEEAIDLLEQSGLNSFAGEFKKAAEGGSTFVFYAPSNEKTLG